MPVESATYIHDLNTANPTHTDGLGQADSHMRLIKAVLKTTFPNLSAAMTASAADLNNTTAAFAVPGTLKAVAGGGVSGTLKLGPIAGGGSVFLTNNASGSTAGGLLINMNSAGDANIQQAAALDRAGNLTIAGTLTAAGVATASGSVIPAGMIMLWHGSGATIPTGWHICDGTNGTPNLLDRFVACAGLSYGVGGTGGAAAAFATSSTNGVHAHGSATSTAGAVALTGSADTQGAHAHTGSTDAHTLTLAETPAHNHGLGGGIVAFTAPGSDYSVNLGTGVAQTGITTDGGSNAHSHGITTDGGHGHNVTVSSVPAHAHTISNDGDHAHNTSVPTLPPFMALCYIMKL